jgi:hypothetical protein
MRLSDWRGRTPHRDSMTSRVIGVVEPVITAMGADRDPSCWVAWGDDPASRYILLIPTEAGLLQVHVRVNVPQEGPRASGKLIRWNRVQTGELAMEVAGGHRLLSFQVESQVLKGSDADADAIAGFALDLFAAADGRMVSRAAAASIGRTSAKTRTVAKKRPAKPLPQLPPPSGA